MENIQLADLSCLALVYGKYTLCLEAIMATIGKDYLCSRFGSIGNCANLLLVAVSFRNTCNAPEQEVVMQVSMLKYRALGSMRLNKHIYSFRSPVCSLSIVFKALDTSGYMQHDFPSSNILFLTVL